MPSASAELDGEDFFSDVTPFQRNVVAHFIEKGFKSLSNLIHRHGRTRET